MAAMTEIPITEDDVNVIEERKCVELSGRKFNELLEYLTRLEDELSITKFDFDSEHRFADLLLYVFIRSIGSISLVSPEMDMKQLAMELLRNCEEHLIGQVKEGYLSAEQLRRFYKAFKRIEGSPNMTY